MLMSLVPRRLRLSLLSVWLLSSLPILLWPAVVVAEPDYFQTGLYVGIDAVLALENFRGSATSADPVAGGDVRVGYRLNRIFSAELFGEFPYDFSYASPGPWQSVRMWSVSANLKASVDMTGWNPRLGRIQPYAVGGVGYYQGWFFDSVDPTVGNSATQNGMARLGGGIDVYILEKLLVAFEARYNFMFNSKRAMDYWSFSMGPQYRF
jgi:opacity protein-like surface antigen